MKMFGYDCWCDAHGEGKNTIYQLMCAEGPLATINVPYLGESDTVIAVKDYSESEGMLEALKGLGVVKAVRGYVQSGFVQVPLVEIDKKKLLSA